MPCRPGALRVVLSVCLLAVTLFLHPWAVWGRPASDPRACLDAVSAALDSADVEAFDRCVDLEGAIASILPVLADMASDPDTSRYMPPVVTLLASQGLLTNRTMSGIFVHEAAAFVRYGVGTGSFGGVPGADYRGGGLLAPLFEAASMGRKEITWTGTPTYTEDSRSTLPFRVRDHDNDQEYDVVGVFSREGSDLPRLVGVANLRDLILVICAEMD